MTGEHVTRKIWSEGGFPKWEIDWGGEEILLRPKSGLERGTYFLLLECRGRLLILGH